MGGQMVPVTSDDIKDLAAALAKVCEKGTIVAKTRTANAGKFSYRYAGLSDVMEFIGPRLSKHGLVLVQPTGLRDGQPVLITRVIHAASGQWIEAVYPLSDYATPQEQGSAITYARRYSLCSLLGIVADEDDDAAAAQAARQTPKVDPLKAKRAELGRVAGEENISPEKAKELLEKWFGKGTTSQDLDLVQLDSAIAGLRSYDEDDGAFAGHDLAGRAWSIPAGAGEGE